MNKDLKATLITISMILGFTGFITLIIAFPIIVLWLLVGITIFCGINIAILLWDSVRTDLDKKDDKDKDNEYSPNKAYWEGLQAKVDADNEKKKREARLKKMMEDDQKLGLYGTFDLDENDKAQIG
jgi:hypothetical protein